MNPTPGQPARPTVKIQPADNLPRGPETSPIWGAGQITVTAGSAYETRSSTYVEPTARKPRQRRMAALDRRKPDGRPVARERFRGDDIERLLAAKNRPERSRPPCRAPISRARHSCSTVSRSASGCWRSIERATGSHPRSADDRAPAPAVARRVPPRVLLDQSPRHHHRHDGRLAGHAEVEPRLLRQHVRRPRGRGADGPDGRAPTTRSSVKSTSARSGSAILSKRCARPARPTIST